MGRGRQAPSFSWTREGEEDVRRVKRIHCNSLEVGGGGEDSGRISIPGLSERIARSFIKRKENVNFSFPH